VVKKIDCACFRHIYTSGFREIGFFGVQGSKWKARRLGFAPAFCSALWVSTFGPRLSSVANALALLFRSFDVRLAVSGMLRLTPTTPSVRGVSVSTPIIGFTQSTIRNSWNIWNAKYLTTKRKFFLETSEVFSPYHSRPAYKKSGEVPDENVELRGGEENLWPFISTPILDSGSWNLSYLRLFRDPLSLWISRS